MRLRTKWLLTSIGGGVLVAAGLLFVPDPFFLAEDDGAHPLIDKVLQAVFWPVPICVYVSGPGSAIGVDPQGKTHYEATPVQLIATLIGFGFSWTFYSSLSFFIVWLLRKQRQEPIEFQVPSMRRPV
jgi:hypothetical protein